MKTSPDEMRKLLWKALDDEAYAHFPEMSCGDDLVAVLRSVLDQNGYTIVPKILTDGMLSAGVGAISYSDGPGSMSEAWAEMLEASPDIL